MAVNDSNDTITARLMLPGNGVAWTTSIFPQKSGGYVLPVKAAVRRDAGIAAGDAVTVSIELL